jgi:hypothetical protein
MEKIVGHVANNFRLNGVVPVQLTNSTCLRRATAEEIEDFDSQNAAAMAAHSVPIRSFRHIYEELQDGASVTYRPILLPEAEWRYWVVDFTGDGRTFRQIEKLLVLTNPPVLLSFCRITGLSSKLDAVRPLTSHLVERAEHLWWRGPREPILHEEELREVCSYVPALDRSEAEYQYVKDAVDKFYDLQRHPPDSDMYALGLFSIIESLITHKPRLNENLDSINHQLTNKILLIEEHFLQKPLTAAGAFGEVSHSTIWKKLYAFRSQLAHTSVSTLSNDLASLKSRDAIVSFVEAKTKELIMFALQRPKLLLHLKAC